jgi:hypothetical protein
MRIAIFALALVSRKRQIYASSSASGSVECAILDKDRLVADFNMRKTACEVVSIALMCGGFASIK